MPLYEAECCDEVDENELPPLGGADEIGIEGSLAATARLRMLAGDDGVAIMPVVVADRAYPLAATRPLAAATVVVWWSGGGRWSCG